MERRIFNDSDANVSVMEKGSKVFGVRSEIKNMNSFKALGKSYKL